MVYLDATVLSMSFLCFAGCATLSTSETGFGTRAAELHVTIVEGPGQFTAAARAVMRAGEAEVYFDRGESLRVNGVRLEPHRLFSHEIDAVLARADEYILEVASPEGAEEITIGGAPRFELVDYAFQETAAGPNVGGTYRSLDQDLRRGDASLGALVIQARGRDARVVAERKEVEDNGAFVIDLSTARAEGGVEPRFASGQAILRLERMVWRRSIPIASFDRLSVAIGSTIEVSLELRMQIGVLPGSQIQEEFVSATRLGPRLHGH